MATYITDAEIEELKKDLKLKFPSKQAEVLVALIDTAIQAAITQHETTYVHTEA